MFAPSTLDSALSFFNSLNFTLLPPKVRLALAGFYPALDDLRATGQH